MELVNDMAKQEVKQTVGRLAKKIDKLEGSRDSINKRALQSSVY